MLLYLPEDFAISDETLTKFAMPIHADLTRHFEETFLPSLPEPHRDAARILHAQIRKLDALRERSAGWFTAGQETARAECAKELVDVATEIREAYKIVLKLAQPQ